LGVILAVPVPVGVRVDVPVGVRVLVGVCVPVGVGVSLALGSGADSVFPILIFHMVIMRIRGPVLWAIPFQGADVEPQIQYESLGVVRHFQSVLLSPFYYL